MEEIVHLADGVSVITPERLENLVRALRLTAHLPGDMAELGVYRGGSAKVIAAVCPLKKLYLFDTFEGLPWSETAERDPEEYVRKGEFRCSEDEVREFLEHNPRVVLIKGPFPVPAVGMSYYWEGHRFSFIHVDCDLYDSAKDAIRFFWSKIAFKGIMFFDDYNCKFTGVTDAVHEAFNEEQIVKQWEPSTGVQIGCYVVKE